MYSLTLCLSVSLCLRAYFKKYSSLHISSVKTGLWTSIYPKLVIYNQIQISVWPLLDRRSLLHKQPFITAHFKSSLHLYVHHCTLKQALLCLSLSLFVSLSVSFSASVSLLSLSVWLSLSSSCLNAMLLLPAWPFRMLVQGSEIHFHSCSHCRVRNVFPILKCFCSSLADFFVTLDLRNCHSV